MAKRNLRVGIILDRSGSMSTCLNETIEAVNKYTKSLRKEEKLKGRLSLTLFDSESIDILWDGLKFPDVPKLNREIYQPRSATPLYDAIGKTVDSLDSENTNNYTGVVLVIVTDGMENASKEYSREAIKRLLDDKQERDGWLVIYLGANQDAFAVGATFGTVAAQTMSYDSNLVNATMASVSDATFRYVSASNRVSGRAAATFTADERKKSKVKKQPA